MGTPLNQLRGRRLPFRATRFRRPRSIRSRSTSEPVSARQRVAVDLRETLVGTNDLDQVGGRVDVNASSNDQLFARYSYSGGDNINPISVRGTDVPGFPRATTSRRTRRRCRTHILSASMTNSVRGTYLRHEFLFDQRLNGPRRSARVRLRLVERRWDRGRRSSTSAATRRSAAPSPVRATRRRARSRCRTAWPGRRLTPGEGRRRVPAHRHRHVPGDRARTRSSCSPARSRPTTRLPTCCSARR